jgi:glycosyltransferase involved in cell wall biosynthesis
MATSPHDFPHPRIAFASSNHRWGGSEELWSLTAIELARRGVQVCAFKRRFHRCDRRVVEMRAAGTRVIDLEGPHWLPLVARRLMTALWRLARPWMAGRMAREFARRHPALVVISQGLNHDGWWLGVVCRRLGLPYVMISQKASDLYWPGDEMLDELREVYRDAASALFVSEHNRRLTEEQLGFALPRGQVVRNPFNARLDDAPSPWPADQGKIVLACLARLDAREKGQDLLIRVLAQPRWRERPIEVRLYGAGHNEQGLRAMAAFHGLQNVVFAGHTDTPRAVWRDSHALILPSRCEGLPLALVEAMLHGRPAIITEAGGNAEVLIDGKTGFLAEAANESALDAALERAWTRRSDWPEIGRAAAAHARQLVTRDPVAALADLLQGLVVH